MDELMSGGKPYPYGARFRGATVGDTSFQHSRLPASDFRELKVKGPVNFQKAEIAGSDFRGTDLGQFDFTGADITGIIIDEDQIKNLKGAKKGTIVLIPDESKSSGLRRVRLSGKLLKLP